jgi:hypothetical protein
MIKKVTFFHYVDKLHDKWTIRKNSIVFSPTKKPSSIEEIMSPGRVSRAFWRQISLIISLSCVVQ